MIGIDPKFKTFLISAAKFSSLIILGWNSFIFFIFINYLVKYLISSSYSELFKSKTIFSSFFVNIFFITFKYMIHINMSNFFEKVLDSILIKKHIDKSVYKGNETNKTMFKISSDDETKLNIEYYKDEKERFTSNISNISKKLEEEIFTKFGQFPDNLIINKDNIVEEIYDAKYYLLNDLEGNENLFLKIKEQKRFFEYLNKKNNKKNDIKLNFVIPKEMKITMKKNYKEYIFNINKLKCISYLKDYSGITVNIKSVELFN